MNKGSTHNAVSQWRSCLGKHPMWVVVFCAGVLYAVGAALNLHTWLQPPHTLEHPLLMLDYQRDYEAACTYARTGVAYIPFGNPGYIIALGSLLKLTGCNVAVPVVMNICFALLTLFLTGRLTADLLGYEAGQERRRIEAVSAGILAAIAGFGLAATVVLKDMGVTFAMACLTYAMVSAIRRQNKVGPMVWAAVGALILMVFKPQMAIFYAVGVIVAVVRRSNIYICLYLALLALLILAGGESFISMSYNGMAANDHSAAILEIDGVSSYGALMKDYYYIPYWQRVLYLPFTVAVQSLLPLPWHITRDLPLGDFFPYGHLTFVWYAVLFLLAVYYIYLFWHSADVTMKRWAVFWIVSYAGVALYSCGTTARYALPLLPAAIPIVVSVLIAIKRAGRGSKLRSFTSRFLPIYIILLIGALVATWFFTGGEF